jgi:hypothetical protein
MQFEFHAEARVEFLEAVSRYETDVPGLGARFITETERCITLLLNAPLIGAPYDGELRRFPLDDGFPFSLIYTVRGEALFIIAVAHQSRKPGYWKHRE